MVTQQSVIAQVRRFAEELRQQHIPLRQVILFGSFARNEQHEWSDIDVALVADGFTGASFIDIKPFVRTVVKHIDIEPHTFSPAQFTDWNPFVKEIKRTGIVVGEWDPDRLESRTMPM